MTKNNKHFCLKTETKNKSTTAAKINTGSDPVMVSGSDPDVFHSSHPRADLDSTV